MSGKSTTLIIILLAATISIFSCKKNVTQKPQGIPDDSVLVIKKIFHPLFIDSTAIADFLSQNNLFQYHADEIKTFYKNRNNQSAWFNAYGIIEQGGLFMNLLDHFGDEGIRDTVIYYSKLKKQFSAISDPGYSYSGSDSLTTQFEMMLTAEFFVYAQKVWFGLNEKTTKELDWYISRKTIPSVSVLDSILAGGKNTFTQYDPQFPQYALLKKYLKSYKEIPEDITWQELKLPSGVKFYKEGDSGLILPEIKNRLLILGDLTEADSTIQFNSATTLAVKLFQYRHGLKPDGSIGEKFLAELNVSPAERIKQLEINMERCRWVPAEGGSQYIFVNIPAYKMYIYADDTLAFSMNVVVGKSTTSTTIFNDELEYIVFSPYWVPPPSILNNEILPALKKNSNYLQKENMEAYDANGKVIDVSGVNWSSYSKMPYRIRQKPGGNNSLGWVKFLFPNEHNIYFHDTPSRSLFKESQRNFSHGCIRLEEPKKLAEYILRYDSTYTAKKIDSLYYLGKETYVKLQEKIPVFIVYFTAWVDENGEINFRKDIYGHDAKLENTLFIRNDK